MDRLSLDVTSEIKYTEQYCYNKERKTLSCQFYLITNRTTTLQEYTIAFRHFRHSLRNVQSAKTQYWC